MNNKFKRFNKILMMTVAILLCFVLISTSVVSGIFAKYVITRSAGATVSLKKFGITLTVTGNETTNIATVDATSTAKTNNKAVTVAVTVNLAPGETATDVISIGISNKASVDTNLKIKFEETNRSGFTVPTSVSGAKLEQDYIPIKMTATMGSTSNRVVLPDWSVVTTGASLQNTMASNMVSNLGFTAVTDESNAVVYQVCSANANPTVTSLKFTISSPKTETATGLSQAKTDEVQTYLSTQTTKFYIIMTISLEQKVS